MQNHIRLKLLACFAFIWMTFFRSGICFAGSVPEIKVEVTLFSETVKVSGTGGSSDAGKRAALVIYKPTADIDDILRNGSFVMQDVVYVSESTVTADLNASAFSFQPTKVENANSGYYTAYVNVGENTVHKAFYWCSKGELAQFLNSVSGASTENAIKGLEAYLPAFGLNESTFSGMDYKNQKVIADSIQKLGISINGDLSNFEAQYNIAYEDINEKYTTAVFNTLKTQAEFAAYFTAYNSYLALDMSTDSVYGLLSESRKQNVQLALIAKDDYTAVSEIRKAFRDLAVKNAIEAVAWPKVPELLTKANLLCGNIFSAYTGVTDQNALFKSFAGKSFDTAEDAAQYFNDSVSNMSHTKSEGGSGGKSSSGGSGGIAFPGIVGVPQGNEGENADQSAGFTDVAGVEWAKEAIEYLSQKGIVKGKSNQNFAPEDSVTRAEFVKMIICAFGNLENTSKVSFDDVPETEWYYGYISAAYRLGFVKGRDNSTFGVNDNITREEICVILNRVLKANKTDQDTDRFSDNGDISDYASEAVYTMRSKKIINGMNDNQFYPKKNATRAEAAQIIYKAIISN